MTIKQQLIPLRIGKGLLSLVALFVMLLAPQMAWAQDYGLTVAGVSVTSENAAAIAGDNIEGTVYYTPQSNTLTLNGASLNGHIVWNNATDLTIHIVGNCFVFGGYPSSDNPVIKGNGGALLFTSSETTPGSLYVGVTSVMSKFASGWNDSSTHIWTVDDDAAPANYDWWANQGCDYMTIAPNKKYDLKVNGTQYCDAWYKQQDRKAEYPNLTITDGNTLHISTKTDYAITSNMPALTVAVMGNASLSSIRFEAAGQVTSGTLTITKDSESDYSMNSLSLKNTKDNLATMSGFSTVEFNSPMTLKTPSETPTWDSYTGDVFVSDFVSYDITVNGVIVSDKNAGNVLGDNSGSVTYDAEANTLTLSNLSCDNSYSEEPFIKNGHGDLIIYLKGESNFVWNSSVFIAKDGNAAEDYTVTFTTIHDNPSRLTFRSSGNVFSTGHQVVYNDGLALDVSDIDSDYHTYDMTISSVEYDLTVAGVRVNSSNASDVLSNGTVSYDSQANKLTLNGAEISSGVEAPGIDYTGTDNLTISFSGTNSIAGTGGCSAIRYNGESQTPPTLTFESSSTSSALTLTGTSKSVIQYFGSVLGVNGINGATGNSLALTNGDVKYDATNGLYTGVDPITPVVSATIASVYGLVVGGVLVHAGNASNVMGNQGTPTVVFDESTNTLTLNGASLTDPIKSNLDNLIIKLKGNNSIVETSDSATLINSYKKTATLSFDVDNELGGSLTLTNRGDGATIKNFASVSLAEGLYIHSNQAGLRYETINNEKCYVAQQNGDSWTMTINQNASYPIWVYKNSTDGYVQVTETNKANILGEQAETKTVTYNGGTLTLNGATINSGSSYAFVMGDNMTALNVVLVGENTVAGNGFQFTSSSASLTFKTNGTDAGSLTIAEGDFVLASTGTTINYQNGLVYDAETKRVGAISAPTISSLLNGLTGERTVEIQGQSQGTVKYSLTYADSKLSVNNVSNQEYSEAFKLLGPATIKATVTVNDVVSPEATAYYFGFADIETVYSTGLVLDAPTLVPATDGVQVHSYPEVAGIASFNQENGKINISGVGSTVLEANFTYTGEDFYVLNPENGVASDNPLYLAQQAVTVVPPTPTIAFDGTKTYLNTDKVTISLPESLAEDQKAVIVYSWDESCEPGNGNNYTDDGVTLNAGTNTLYAWVRYNGQTADDAVYSERVSQVFTVKTDIDQFAVKDMIATDSTYTGSAIEPTFTLYDAKEPTNTLSAENYDVRIEKYVDETTGYSVVTSVLDAGTYKVYAVGKGDTYGGEKLIYEALVVNKANIQGLPTVAADDLVYDGTEQVLLPITVPDGVTVEYFFASITEEDYKGSYDPNCAGEVTYSTNIPKATNAGYFAIIYKVNGGNNYNNILPSGTIKVAILPAAITEVTLSENTKEYNGQAQTVTIESVKADNLVLSAEKEDYSVSYEKVEAQGTTPVDAPLEVGNYNVIVTGEGNFTGSADATFTISDRTLVVSDVTFHNGWTTYYSADGNVLLPANSNVGAFVASGVGENSVTVTQISNIPEGVAVLLNNATETTTTNVYGTDVKGNLLVHATSNKQVDPTEGDFYGLYNGVFMRVTDMFPAGKNYLLIPNAVNVNTGAPKLNIVFDNEANMTGIDEVRSKMEDVRGDVYDLQGRKVQKPSKKGLYINKGHKVVINK